MPTAAPTATIETGHVQSPTGQSAQEAAEEAARALLQRISPWLAQALVESGGELDLRIHLIAPTTRPNRQAGNIYRILAAVYENPDRRTTLTLRKAPKQVDRAAIA